MYSILPSFVLGFHGCDRAIGEEVLAGQRPLIASENDHDWLGPGMYFWENNPDRAYSYVQSLMRIKERATRPIRDPFVLGAVIDLGYCLNLSDEPALQEVKAAHASLADMLTAAGLAHPANAAGYKGDEDLLKRNLDCAVFRTLHKLRDDSRQAPYETVRSPFLEGAPIYPQAGFRTQTHIQICVREQSCIKGYFRPLKADGTLMFG